MTFPSGVRKVLAWRHEGQVDALGLAKDLAARALDSCLREQRTADAELTNWASFAAGALRVVRDWEAARPSGGGSLKGVGGEGEAPRLQ